MSINSIEIKETTWNEEKQHYEIKYKTITRDEYSGDFEDLILENINRSDIRYYAENELDMIEEDDCECDEKELHDFQDYEIISYLEENGFEVIKCQTIIDKMKLEKVKELMAV